jgi:hypothetical protein
VIRILAWGAIAVLAALAIAVAVACAIGACLPRHHLATRARTLAATRAAVWALISEPRGYGAWRRGVDGVAVLAEQPRLRWREGAGRDAVTYELMESDGGARQVVRIADDEHRLPYGGSWTYALTDDGEGTRVSITEDGEVRNAFFRFVSRFIIGHSWTIDRYLDDLAAALAAHGGRAGN